VENISTRDWTSDVRAEQVEQVEQVDSREYWMSGREAGPRSAEQMGMPVTKLEAGKRSNMMRPFGKYIIRDSVSGAEEDAAR
jgi:hypothetical protein